jgi:hypothetical protein
LLLEGIRTELRGHHLLERELLPGGDRQQLVGRLGRGKPALGVLAPVDRRSERLGIATGVGDDAGLNGHRPAKGVAARVIAGAGRLQPLVARGGRVELARVERAQPGIELRDVEVDALRLLHQLVDAPERVAKRLELRKVDALQVPVHAKQHLRLVLELLDLIADLLERARRGQDVLAVVARIEHADLRVRRGREAQR